MSELELGGDLRQRIEPSARAAPCIRQRERIEPCRHERCKSAVAVHRIDQIEYGQRPAGGQSIKLTEVGGECHDLGGVTERAERTGYGVRRHQSVDLVGTAFRRRVHDRDEALAAGHQAVLRRRSVSLRANP